MLITMKRYQIGILIASMIILTGFSYAHLWANSAQLEIREWKGIYGGPDRAYEIVAITQGEWENMWAMVSQKPPVPLDVSRDMAVGIFLGLRRTGGYGIKIISAKEEAGVFVVRYLETKPTGFVTQALTSPYLIKLFPKTDIQVTFKKSDSNQNKEY